ncbi:MAG TPA: hypothetical protein VKC61_01600 [Pyrinomonadaceae bacterium]|nr:hypothetical protein [Pyrinomonadaceae bacterium]
MAQRNPNPGDDPVTPELARKELERLAEEQDVKPISNLDTLRADFWPKDESVDDFVRSVRERRRASQIRSIE